MVPSLHHHFNLLIIVVILAFSSTTLTGSKVKEAGIEAGEQAERHMNILLDMDNADVNLLPVSHFDASGLLEVNYFVHIVLRRQGVHRNISLDIPIKVASHE